MRARWLAFIALACLAVAALGWIVAPRHFFASWLAAASVLASIALGSVGLLLAAPLTGGRWAASVRPAFARGACAVPLLLLAAVPVAIGLPDLYPWARPDAHVPNGFYLNTHFFTLRACAYLLIWLALAGLALRPRPPRGALPAALFLLGVTVSFAAIDTTLSLDPEFASSIYGMLTATGMALLALALAVAQAATAAPAERRADLAKLLLSLVILLAYLDFMQLLIVWQSDLPTEAPWYLARTRGYWGAVRAVTAFAQFAVPLALLLSPRMQASRVIVRNVAVLLVAAAILRAWWTVLPSLDLHIDWIDLACMAGVGAASLGFGRWAAARPVLARRLRDV